MGDKNLDRLEQQIPFLPTGEESDESGEGFKQTLVQELLPPSNGFAKWFTVVSICLSSVFLVAGAFGQPTEVQCARAMTGWSPMLEAVEYHHSNEAYLSRAQYMGPPNSQLEEVWDVLWKGGSLGISEDKLPLMNKSLTERNWYHLPDKEGGGIQAFFEGFHDLHCINLARQYIYRHQWDYSQNHFFTSEHVPILHHTQHCLEMLRAKFTCDADTTPYMIINDTKLGKVVDVQTVRSCRNISKIKMWMQDNMIIKDS